MKRKFVVVVTGVVLILAIFALAPLFRVPRSFEEVLQKYPKGTLARKALNDFIPKGVMLTLFSTVGE